MGGMGGERDAGRQGGRQAYGAGHGSERGGHVEEHVQHASDQERERRQERGEMTVLHELAFTNSHSTIQSSLASYQHRDGWWDLSDRQRRWPSPSRQLQK